MPDIVGEHHVLHSLNIVVHNRPQNDQIRCRARRRLSAPHRLCIDFHLTLACVTTSMHHSKSESQDLRNKLIDVLGGGDSNRTFTPDHDRVQLQQRHSPLLSLRPVLHAGRFNRGDTKNRVC